jgi:hypothetical protein
MTTRSSRFFVVLLHSVGVSTHLPSSFQNTGIVGVNPFSIVLESSDPQKLLSTDSAYSMQPHWLQDTFDQTCLDPMGGFSECGDATLWLVIPTRRRHARRRQWIRWATEDEDEDKEDIQGYALLLVDDDSYLQQSTADTPKSPSAQDFAQKECLTRRRKDNQLVLAPCSQDRAWYWKFNQQGILHFEKQKKFLKPQQNRLLKKQTTLDSCIGRNASQAVFLSCDGEAPQQQQQNLTSDRDERVVQIDLVRQATATASTAFTTTTIPSSAGKQQTFSSSSHRNQEATGSTIIREEQRLPSRVDIAHSHASAGTAESMKLKPGKRLTSLSPPKASTEKSKTATSRPPLHFLKDTNPILLAGGVAKSKPNKLTPEASAKPNLLHETRASSAAPMKPVIRKIEMNPYIVSSEEERWKDPQTGLVYHTDLCNYLGHERKEVGRHTLTGVGQFMKTVFNIKVSTNNKRTKEGRIVFVPSTVCSPRSLYYSQVYGVAFYVSKRDVLADPAMDAYASLSSGELRARPEFFDVLRHMAPSSNPNAGTFDRTLFLKTNMQLGTDTMRSSLHADWKMLTPEAKDLLIGSSMKPRPASDRVLDIITSPDNPSKCSCAQIAPPEYQADPDCCARGTELVFTWRKTGALEVRLNGDFMDSFARPDIATAIFFEYLRMDDPMSVDFLDHAVDGFPMLLGPLSQVKGISSPVLSHPAAASSTTTPKSSTAGHGSNPVFKVFEGVGGALSSHANTFAGFVQNGASELSSNAINRAKTVGGAAKNLGEEMERKRDLIGKHVSQFAQQIMSSFYGKDQKSVTVLPNFSWIGDFGDFDIPNDSKERLNSNAPRGHIFRTTLSRFLGILPDQPFPAAPDEIVPMIHDPSTNSTQRIFLGMVHLYLLLMLIVSFPAQLTKRTKMVVIRKTCAQAISDSENSDSEGSTEGSLDDEMSANEKSRTNGTPRFCAFLPRRPTHEEEACPTNNKEGKIKKSLSYML